MLLTKCCSSSHRQRPARSRGRTVWALLVYLTPSPPISCWCNSQQLIVNGGGGTDALRMAPPGGASVARFSRRMCTQSRWGVATPTTPADTSGFPGGLSMPAGVARWRTVSATLYSRTTPPWAKIAQAALCAGRITDHRVDGINLWERGAPISYL